MTIEDKIREVCELIGFPVSLALAIAEVESAMGKYQLSPTGARGVFQMTSIAMKDLLLEMERHDDEWVDILCGLAFLHVLKRRWKEPEAIVKRYCDPAEKDAYWEKVVAKMNPLQNTNGRYPV